MKPSRPILGICFLALFVNPSARAATMVAKWDFNVPVVFATADTVAGYVGRFQLSGAQTIAGGGVTGQPGDRAYTQISFGGSLSLARIDASDAGFLSALNTAAAGQQLSVTFWQNLNSAPNATAFWAESPSATGLNGMSARTSSPDGMGFFDTSGCCESPGNRLSGALGASIGTWELMSFVYDNGTKSIYRGTTLIASSTGALPLKTDFTGFYIGNSNNWSGGMLGRIDDFTIWKGALTPAEIGALVVPEPATGLLGLVAALSLGLRRRRA
jgi:hypothetical protein